VANDQHPQPETDAKHQEPIFIRMEPY
jgi:hypothetical protein